MKNIIVALFLCVCYFFSQAQSSLIINRSNYYKVIGTENIDSINEQIEFVKNSEEKFKDAFEGALMMKKAALLKGAANKLKEFNTGKKKLEDVLQKNKNVAELRFLRLIIQENAPKILGYHKDLEEDQQYIVANFKTISEPVQQAIKDYSKSSKTLSSSDF
jgi:hypothetical protein